MTPDTPRKKSSSRSYHIYAIELKSSLLDKKQVADANPGYCYRDARPLIYVGMTGRSPELRYAQHCSGYKASRYTRSNCVRLRKDLFEHLRPMPYEDAVQMEISFANELRKNGFAVWQK